MPRLDQALMFERREVFFELIPEILVGVGIGKNKLAIRFLRR
jgi:hypothetical protein